MNTCIINKGEHIFRSAGGTIWFYGGRTKGHVLISTYHRAEMVEETHKQGKISMKSFAVTDRMARVDLIDQCLSYNGFDQKNI